MATQAIKIGLALGGGGAKGLAHVGVLRVFEKYGIKISSIAGTSAGAIIGAPYALGLTADQILTHSEKFMKIKLLRISNFHLFNESLIKNDDAIAAIKDLTGEKTFSETKIPFKAIAVDLESGEEVVLENGKLWEALCASSAIPGIFSPCFINGKYLVDGGLLNNVPVNHLRKENLDIVIGVELGSFTSKQYISGIIWEKYYKKPSGKQNSLEYFEMLKVNSTLMIHILLRSIDILREEAQNHRYDKAQPDIIIKPDVENIALLEFSHYKEAIEAGEQAAEKIMPELLKLIQEKTNSLS